MGHAQKKLTPNWFMRMLGAKAATFSLEAGGLLVAMKSGHEYSIAIEDMARSIRIVDGLFFSILVLETSQGRKKFSWLRNREASSLYSWLRRYWVEQLAPVVVDAAIQIKAALKNGYLRTSRLENLENLATSTVEKFVNVPDERWGVDVDLAAFKYVFDFSNWDDAAAEDWRARYVAYMRNQYADFFNSVESNPLTERQCEACIIDEDNNLVLAGAGTGKTSTMVGRAGFLIKSNQAKPEDILMLAFANKAAGEMQERIEERLGNSGIVASTFHKLGKEIIASVDGAQPLLSPLAEDDKLLAWQINQWFEDRLKEKSYQKLVIEYFQSHMYPEVNSFDFESEGEYYEYIFANEIRTLKGELVKSLGECLIANYLFEQGVEYEYEPAYEHKTRDLEFRQYQPDFYLPEYGVYLEYYGIDRNGDTAPYVDREKYHDGIEWKRALHQMHQTGLIETCHHQRMDGTLFGEIDRLMGIVGVEYKPLPPEAILETLREFGAISTFAGLLADLLRRYRANCYDEEKLEAAISSAENSPQVRAAVNLLQPIVEDYENLLKENEQIDFDDMIGKAIEYVKTGQFKSPWSYILVDEFQDISEPRARLVQMLKESADECSLYCVGDDWQAIYRFTGSDLGFTTKFNEIFGPTRITVLDLTFRFNNSISDIASRFVLQNPAQVKKHLVTNAQIDRPAVSILRADNRRQFNDLEPDGRLKSILQRIAMFAGNGEKVYLLGRYGFNLPDKSQMRKLKALVPALELEAHTIHSSKGKEADYVVVLGLEHGKHGFPSEKITHPLLEALLPRLEDFPFAEERRLFYVAVTRARKRVYLVADMAVASSFVIELIDDKYPVELNEFEASLTQKLFQLIHCVKCKTGSLVSREGKHGKFFGCNNFPLCNHAENGCPTCGSVMQRLDRFKVCINPDCDSWVPTCPECGAEMVKRKGRYGMFWGCKNYRGDEPLSCKHSENQIEFERSG